MAKLWRRTEMQRRTRRASWAAGCPPAARRSRMAPLRDGNADYCACGAAAFFGQEAAFLFASEEWGPQPLRVVLTAVGENNLSLATAKDAGIATMADLKSRGCGIIYISLRFFTCCCGCTISAVCI